MRYIISDAIADTINQIVADAKATHKILDIYKLASGVQKLHASDNVALEDIIERLVSVAGSSCAIEFKTPLGAFIGSAPSVSSETQPMLNGHAVMKPD